MSSSPGTSLLPVSSACTEKWAVTTIKVVRFNYTWTVYNFSFCNEKTGEKIFSPIFKDNSENENEWQLRLYPNGENDEHKNSLSLYLCLVKSWKKEIRAKFGLFLLNEKKEKVTLKRSTCIDKFIPNNPNGSWGWADFAKRDYVLDATNKLLTNDRLTIVCEVSAIAGTVGISGEGISSSTTITSSNTRLSDDFEGLLETEKFADVRMTVNDLGYRAHAAIMSARSAIFAQMLRDKKAGELKILNLEITNNDVMREMLKFLYTGKTGDIELISRDLLKIANKYELKRLKVICENAISKSLKINNAVDTLIFADEQRATKLKDKSIEFINTYADGVKDTPAFAEMFITHPQLIAAIALERVSKMMNNGNS